MPELPEVETVARLVRPDLLGRTIVGADVSWERSVGGPDEETWLEVLRLYVKPLVEDTFTGFYSDVIYLFFIMMVRSLDGGWWPPDAHIVDMGNTCCVVQYRDRSMWEYV